MDRYVDEEEDEFICIGDHICLFCEHASGYLFSEQSNSMGNGLYMFHKQVMDRPHDIPNPHALSFRITVQNRYKMGKRYRQLLQEGDTFSHDPIRHQTMLEEAKAAADAESMDNSVEQKRLHGKPVKYGDVIQLLHLYSNKKVHVNQKKASRRERGQFTINLLPYDAKDAQFVILPKYKINVEGETVRVEDQVVFESVQCPGRYFHASPPFMHFNNQTRHELNMGREASEFTVSKRFKLRDFGGVCRNLWGGAMIYLQHKDIEAYLACDGVFDEDNHEDVHLSVHETNLMQPTSLYPPTSFQCFWQITKETSPLNGEPFAWGEYLRIEHFPSRSYLCLSDDGSVGTTTDGGSPDAVFRFHSVHKTRYGRFIDDGDFARIQHVKTGRWLHGCKDKDYTRKLDDPLCERTSLKQVSSTEDMQYPDAYSLLSVSFDLFEDANYVLGMLPLFQQSLQSIRDGDADVDDSTMKSLISALDELTVFISDEKLAPKVVQRRKESMRELKLIDKAICIVQAIDAEVARGKLVVFKKSVYTFLLQCIRNDISNCLYMALHMDFLQSRICSRKNGGIHITEIMVELTMDKKQVIDRFSTSQIEKFVNLLKKHENYQYFRLLSALCVCKGTAITIHQSLIADRILPDRKGHLYKFLIQNKQLFLRKNEVQEPMELSHFIDSNSKDDQLFLEEQLKLFGNLCKGRHEQNIRALTDTHGWISWEIILTALRSHRLQNNIKALFCDLVIDVFVDVGENTPTSECISNSYMYDKLNVKKKSEEWLIQQVQYVDRTLDRNIPVIQAWLVSFLNKLYFLVADETSTNKLILAAVKLTRYLMAYGYFSADSFRSIVPCIIFLLDGSRDLPFTMSLTSKKSELAAKVHQYQQRGRFEDKDENKALIDIRQELLLILEQCLSLQFYYRLEMFIATFKNVEMKNSASARKRHALTDLLYGTRSLELGVMRLFSLHPRVKLDRYLEEIMNRSSLISEDVLLSLLMDLSRYENDELTSKALMLIVNHHNALPSLLEAGLNAQLLLTEETCSALREIQIFMPLLRRLVSGELCDDQVHILCAILSKLKQLCSKHDETTNAFTRHTLVNQDILPVLMAVMEKESKKKAKDVNKARQFMIQHTLELLADLAQESPRVQRFLFENIQPLLDTKVALHQMANTLFKIFHNNWSVCNEVEFSHFRRLVRLVCRHRHKFPAILRVLCVLVKPDDTRICGKNQYMVIRLLPDIIQGDPNRTASLTLAERHRILLGKEGENKRDYLIYFLKLVSFCTLAMEDKKSLKKVEGSALSLLEDADRLNDVLALLADKEIDLNLKRPYLQLLCDLYLGPYTYYAIQSPEELPLLWKFLGNVCGTLETLVRHIESVKPGSFRPVDVTEILASDASAPDIISHHLTFVFDGFFPFIICLMEHYTFDPDYQEENFKTLKRLTGKLAALATVIGPLVATHEQARLVVKVTKTCMETVGYGEGALSDVLQQFKEGLTTRQTSTNSVLEEHSALALREVNINSQLRTFVGNCQKLQIKPNTIEAQLNITGYNISKSEYTELGTAQQLPLSAEFQNLVSTFIDDSHGSTHLRYRATRALVRQLSHASLHPENHRATKQLEICCLQILRALLHNIIIVLPETTAFKMQRKSFQRNLARIHQLQQFFIDEDLVPVLIKLMGSQDMDIFRECMALLDVLLYDANILVQDVIIKCFKATREEVFFMLIRDYFTRSVNSTKEKRYMERKTARSNKMTGTFKRNDGEVQGNIKPNGRLRLLNLKRSPARTKVSPQKTDPNDLDDVINSLLEYQKEESKELAEAEDSTSLKDNTVLLILQVMSRLCDGQHNPLQDYMREQSDNLRSFNLVAAVTNYMGLLYTIIRHDTMEMTISVLTTLNELCSGNQANRLVILDCKAIDYINVILRQSSFSGCTTRQVLTLYKAMAELLISLTEENSPKALRVAQDVAQTLDTNAVVVLMHRCHQLYMMRWYSRPKQGHDDIKVFSKMDKEEHKLMCEFSKRVGFRFYYVYARAISICPIASDRIESSTLQRACRALEYFDQNTASIEIVKEGVLQKIYFYVSKSTAIRAEVKEKIKWNVDRSSASNKIRNFMQWSKYIISDINHHQRVTKNPVARLLCNKRILWSYFTIILSLVINVLMLVTWMAPASLSDVITVNNTLPSSLYILKPDVTIGWDLYWKLLRGFGYTHNIMSLFMLISYLIAEHPKLPSCETLLGYCSRSDSARDRQQHESLPVNQGFSRGEYAPSLVSMATFFHLISFGLSVAGTFTYGYFFAFHLLLIVNVNDLLQGVIRAVTANGKSLLWVAILGLVILYIYALIGFAFFRPSFDPTQELYCESLRQCSVTIIRYGLLGDINEKLTRNPLENSFEAFGFQTIYQVTFFIFFTTIGLNIIFGIIVDTFSELRDLKWRAEKDMQECCFICSLPSFEFELRGKGFLHHTRHEHNMWMYVYYFIYLANTNPRDYTALDYYVARQREHEQYDFFPVNQALSLAREDQHTEDKLDILAKDVHFLIDQHLQQDMNFKIRAENSEETDFRKRLMKRRSNDALDVPSEYGFLTIGRHLDRSAAPSSAASETASQTGTGVTVTAPETQQASQQGTEGAPQQGQSRPDDS